MPPVPTLDPSLMVTSTKIYIKKSFEKIQLYSNHGIQECIFFLKIHSMRTMFWNLSIIEALYIIYLYISLIEAWIYSEIKH